MFWRLTAFFYDQHPSVLVTPTLVTRAMDCACRHNERTAMHPHNKEIR